MPTVRAQQAQVMDPRAIVAIMLVLVVLVATLGYTALRFVGSGPASIESRELWIGLLTSIIAAVSVWLGGGKGD